MFLNYCLEAEPINNNLLSLLTENKFMLDFNNSSYYYHYVECLRQYVLTKSIRNINMSINLKNKQEIISKFGKDSKDTGSTEVQVAMLTQKISELTEHLKTNKNDYATKRGLLMMVGKRKGLLSYLKSKDLEGYRKLIKELSIRG